MTLRVIGYWSNEQHPELPDANAFVDMTWNEDERHIVSMYYARGTIARTFMGPFDLSHLRRQERLS